jgi:hypothetical protein
MEEVAPEGREGESTTFELRTTETMINDDDACEKPKRAGPVRGRMYCHDQDDDDIAVSPRVIVVSTGCCYVATCPSMIVLADPAG